MRTRPIAPNPANKPKTGIGELGVDADVGGMVDIADSGVAAGVAVETAVSSGRMSVYPLERPDEETYDVTEIINI